MIREDARGEAGGATATPIFQDLVKELSPKILKKKIPFIGGYPNFKFLTSSLVKTQLLSTTYYINIPTQEVKY